MAKQISTILMKDLPIKETSITEDDYVVVSGGGTKKLKIKDITKDVEKKTADLEEKTIELGSQLDTIANKGTTVDVLERVTKEEIERQINDGTIANLTIEDNSITNDKYKEKSISINKVDFINYSENTNGNLIDETIFIGKKVSELERFINPITNGDMKHYWKLQNTTEDLSTLKNMWKHFLSINSWHSKKSESEGILVFWGTQLYLIVKP